MNFGSVIAIIAALVGITFGAALIFWHKILDWAEASLFPWIERQFPLILDTVKNAFVFLDKFTSPTRLAIKKSWEKLREYLLKQVINIEKSSSNQWVKRVISWIVQVLDNGQKIPVKVETEEYIAYEELPQDVREEWIRRQERSAEFNVTDLRDKELREEDDGMSMAT